MVRIEHCVGIAACRYYAFTKRAPSARALRDAQLALLIAQVYEGNYHAYGVVLSIRYSQRLDDNIIVASVGSVGDSYDNAMT